MAVLQCVTVCYSCVTTAPPAAELMMHKNKIITFTLIHKTEGGTTRRNMEGRWGATVSNQEAGSGGELVPDWFISFTKESCRFWESGQKGREFIIFGPSAAVDLRTSGHLQGAPTTVRHFDTTQANFHRWKDI